eukprot:gene14994-17730_t
MVQAANQKDFSDVDKTRDPKSFITYLDTVSESEVAKTIGRVIHSHMNLQPGFKVADLGCGTGNDIKSILDDVGQDGEISGVDFSEEMIKFCQNRFSDNKNINLSVASADDCKLPSDYYNVVRCERLLQHVPSPAKVVEEMVRISVNGGLVSVIDTDWDSSRVSCISSELKDIAGRVFQAKFNCHPDVGLDLQRIFIEEPKLTQVRTYGYLLTTTSLQTANQVYVFTIRVQRAVDQGLITEAEQQLFLTAMEEADKNQTFLFSINYFNTIGVVAK